MRPATAAKSSRHVPALDGVRGIAILLVLAIHSSLAVDPKSIFEIALRRVTSLGWTGVDLFFVLSGFLITGILADTRGQPDFFRNFFMRRLLRIFPLYYAALLVLCVALPVLPAYRAAAQPMLDHQFWVWAYGTNILLTLLPSHALFVLTHFWSLAVEEHFYLVWPLLVWLLPPRKMLAASLLVIAVALLFRLWLVVATPYPFGTFLLTPSRIDALATGGFIALLVRQRGGDVRSLLRPALWIGAVSLAGLAAIWLRRFDLDRSGDRVFQVAGYSLLAFFWATLIVTALALSPQSAIRRLLEHPALTFCGKYSYGIYVLHWPLLILLAQGIRLPEMLEAALPNRSLAMLAFYPIVIGAVIAAALASYGLVEKPFLDLKRIFPDRGRSAPQAGEETGPPPLPGTPLPADAIASLPATQGPVYPPQSASGLPAYDRYTRP